jgi:WD40 repeat protein
VQIFERSEAGEWRLVGKCSGHNAAVLRLSWAHPQFGQVLASCSLDSSVCIWEERESVDDFGGTKVADWAKRAILTNFADGVHDVEFAPRHCGLELAAGSADGAVRIFGVDEGLDLDVWMMRHQFEPLGGSAVTAISWNPSRFDAPTLVVGGESPDLSVWALAKAVKRWVRLCVLPAECMLVTDVAWAPDAGRSYHLVASACRNAPGSSIARSASASSSAAAAAGSSPSAGKLASGTVSLWRLEFREDDDEADPDTEDEAEAEEAAAGRARAGAAASGTGEEDRAGSLVEAAANRSLAAATASMSAGSRAAAARGMPDQTLRHLIGITDEKEGSDVRFKAVSGVAARKECDVCSSDADGTGEVWRVRWGVVSSMLATTGDDGVVRMWRRRLRGDWACAQQFEVADTERVGAVAMGEQAPTATAVGPTATPAADYDF